MKWVGNGLSECLSNFSVGILHLPTPDDFIQTGERGKKKSCLLSPLLHLIPSSYTIHFFLFPLSFLSPFFLLLLYTSLSLHYFSFSHSSFSIPSPYPIIPPSLPPRSSLHHSPLPFPTSHLSVHFPSLSTTSLTPVSPFYSLPCTPLLA